MKEKKTKHRIKHGWRLWMFPKQARETSTNDLIKVTDKMLDTLQGKKDEE